MRFFSRRVGLVAVFFVSFLFFPFTAEAGKKSCDPESEFYNAQACFEYVRLLEVKNANTKRDLAVSQSEIVAARSRLEATHVLHARVSTGLRADIESGLKTIGFLT